MLTENLAREKEITATNIDDALDLLSTDYLVLEKGADLRDITLNEDSTITFGTESFQITDWAFESLCYLIRIPVTFARSIPISLLVENIIKLKLERNLRLSLIICRGVVINVVDISKKPYLPAKNHELLSILKKEIVPLTKLQLNKISISDRGMEVSLIAPGQKLEPIPGDVTEVGLTISNSETGWRGAKASYYLLRLVCTNGAVMSNSWGAAEWTYDYRISMNRSYSRFTENILKLQPDFVNLDNSYKRMLDRDLMAFEYVNLHRRLSRIVGNDKADQITMISKEDRTRFAKETREGNRLVHTGAIAYDLYNHITAAARSYEYKQRQSLEAVGGAMIELGSNDLNS